jgi:hypothetical protein
MFLTADTKVSASISLFFSMLCFTECGNQIHDKDAPGGDKRAIRVFDPNRAVSRHLDLCGLSADMLEAMFVCVCDHEDVVEINFDSITITYVYQANAGTSLRNSCTFYIRTPVKPMPLPLCRPPSYHAGSTRISSLRTSCVAKRLPKPTSLPF